MLNNKIESNLGQPEILNKEQLREQLISAREQREKMLVVSPDFYDEELFKFYAEAATRFGADSSQLPNYIKISGYNYDEVLENYQNFIDFKDNKLKPIEQEINNISKAIGQLEREEAIIANEQKEQQEEKKYREEKESLIKFLYGKLDAIHTKIPAEAKEVGMSTEMALKTYLPGSVGDVRELEGYIQEAE